ncbi:hypothetical protein LGMK_01120 [Leuconostoc sp. C2]|uniref:Uncharacterized protein n=1 Tax=Leuconostoc kimchii (strain IMSNU 11154 / KCTC 2386 / IH25) TaxID=762051 RepID=D5T0Q6_LEUKI|nr:hypothetical protein LKI_01560 [Leuconostoc kimchii IMSNU 11154]AEJ30286.1 hypothetical protein LGMK_01120 [Leuconostoc sp. C2]
MEKSVGGLYRVTQKCDIKCHKLQDKTSRNRYERKIRF